MNALNWHGAFNKDCAYKYGESALPGQPCLFGLPHRVQNAKLEGNMQQRIAGLMSKRSD